METVRIIGKPPHEPETSIRPRLISRGNPASFSLTDPDKRDTSIRPRLISRGNIVAEALLPVNASLQFGHGLLAVETATSTGEGRKGTETTSIRPRLISRGNGARLHA